MKYSNVTDGIFRLSAHIHDLLFEGMWPLPHGMSMNSYIVQGKEIALIDGVCGWDGVPETLFSQFEEMGLSVQDIRYVVLNHMEPDHTGWLGPLKHITRGFELVATPKALHLAKSFFGLDESFCTLHPVQSGDRIDLGKGKVLRFEEIPHVHWPETMATYEESSRTLFPCDAFGSFGAIREEAPFDDQLSESELAFFEEEAVRYFANIVVAFSGPVKKALEKVDALDIRILAPGHGIVWRKNPGRIVELYRRLAQWSSAPTEPEITLLWAGTELSMGPLVKAAIEGAREEGVQIHVHKVPDTHISYILPSVLRSSGVILGIPYARDPLPSPLAHALDDLGRKRMTGRKFFWFLQWKGLEPEGERLSETLEEEIDRILEKYQMRWEALESAHIPTHTEEFVYQQSRALAMELLAGGAIKGHVQELVGAP